VVHECEACGQGGWTLLPLYLDELRERLSEIIRAGESGVQGKEGHDVIAPGVDEAASMVLDRVPHPAREVIELLAEFPVTLDPSGALPDVIDELSHSIPIRDEHRVVGAECGDPGSTQETIPQEYLRLDEIPRSLVNASFAAFSRIHLGKDIRLEPVLEKEDSIETGSIGLIEGARYGRDLLQIGKERGWADGLCMRQCPTFDRMLIQIQAWNSIE